MRNNAGLQTSRRKRPARMFALWDVIKDVTSDYVSIITFNIEQEVSDRVRLNGLYKFLATNVIRLVEFLASLCDLMKK